MKAFLKYLFLASVAIIAAACGSPSDSGEPAVSLAVDKNSVEFEAAGGTVQVRVDAASEPVVRRSDIWFSAECEASGKSWTVQISATANTGAQGRTGKLSVLSGGESAEIIVSQKGYAASDDRPIVGESAEEALKNIVIGYNIGNSLESTGGETAWGNPAISQKFVDGIAAAGFNAVRIPCAWNQYVIEQKAPYTISLEWMARVKEVVDYAMAKDMYVILNCHWDGGWLEVHANERDMDAVAEKEHCLWTQIATAFADYGSKLIFAGNNEIRNKVGDNEKWSSPDAGERRALLKYNQTFVDAVRSTGGGNATRNLVVQPWCCNPWYALSDFDLPSDPSAGHLMVEVHYYEPMDFSHSADNVRKWGHRKGYTDVTACQEDYVDKLFGNIRAAFADKGIPVVLGEYGTVCHSTTEADVMESEAYYLEYVTRAARANGFAPFYWDNGQPGVGMFGILDRTDGSVAVPHMLAGLMAGTE